MLEKKVVNVPSNKVYTSPEDIAALGKFLKKVKEKQENYVTLQEDNLILPEEDIRTGEIKELKNHQELIKNKVNSIDDLNKEIIDLSLSQTKLKLENHKDLLSGDDKIDSLPKDSDKLNDNSDTSLKDFKEALKVRENLTLEDSKETINDNNKISLETEKEKLEDKGISELINKKEELGVQEEISLETEASNLKENQEQIALSDKKSDIHDLREVSLADDSSLLEGDKEVELENDSSLLDGDKEVELENDSSKITDYSSLQLEDKSSLLDGDKEVELENDSSKITDNNVPQLEEDKSLLDVDENNELTKDFSPLSSPAKDGDITKYLKDYSGYSAGMKYLMNLSGDKQVSLTPEERKTLDEIKKYIGLDTRDDVSAAKYQITVDSLKKMGTWGEKFAAYLTAVLNRNKHFRSTVPYSDIDLLYVALTSWGKETGLALSYGEADDRLEGEKAHFSFPEQLYKFSQKPHIGDKTEKTTTGDKKYYNISESSPGNEEKINTTQELDRFQKEQLQTIELPKDQEEELWDESSHEAFSQGKGENLRIPESKLPDISWKTGAKIGTYLRYSIEQTIGKLHNPSITGVTRQQLIDSSLNALIIARQELEKATKIEKYRLPGTGNKILSKTVNLVSKGINQSSLVGLYKQLSDVDSNTQINAPMDTLNPFANIENISPVSTVWQKRGNNYPFIGNYNATLDGHVYSGLKITLNDLTKISDFKTDTLANYDLFLNKIKTSSKISNINLYASTDFGKPKVMTLDSNHVWEVTLEPYLGPENGNISFLPAYREINQINKSTHGYETSWFDWIPFTSYELNIKKLLTKTTPLYEGEIVYPTGMEFTNELRLTIADDQYKSWKMYFEEVIKCMAYLSRPHSSNGAFHWELHSTKASYVKNNEEYVSNVYSSKAECELQRAAKASELTQQSYTIDSNTIEEVEGVVSGSQKKEIKSELFSSYDACQGAMELKRRSLPNATGFVSTVAIASPVSVVYETAADWNQNTFGLRNFSSDRDVKYDTQYQYIIQYSETQQGKGYRFKINYSNYDRVVTRNTYPSFYDPNNTDHSAVLEGVINPAPYKNVTFRCRIYSMTPQFSTIQKYDLLVVLRDFQEEFQGEIDSGPTDLTLAFSIVGENPIGNSVLPVSVMDKNIKQEVQPQEETQNTSFLGKLKSKALNILK